MHSWPLCPTDGCGRIGISPLGGDVAAGLVDAIAAPDFSTRVLEQINRVLLAGSLSAYVLGRDGGPVLLASATSERPDRTAECWRAYASTLYREDRTFDAAWQSSTALMSHCTMDSFAPAHRARIYEPARSFERLSVTAPVGSDRLLAVNLYRNLGQPPFSADDAAIAASFAMTLISCVRQNARLRVAIPRQSEPLRTGTVDVVSMTERLRSLCPRLTPREIEVLANLVRGLTYDGAAAATGVSVASVKTYRARAFQKLGIHFRNELNALLVDANH